MSRLHTALSGSAILIGLGFGFLLTASTSLPVEQFATALAASVADAVIAVLAVAVSAMSVLAAWLVGADFRTDHATAQSWQSLDSQTILEDRPSEVGATEVGTTEVDWPYTPRPQDEHARRIFLTLRLSMPERQSGDGHRTASAAKAAEPSATDAASTPLICQPDASAPTREIDTVARAPTLVADNPAIKRRTTSIAQSRLARQGTNDRLVANAGKWWAGALHQTGSAAVAPHSACVIVLADAGRRGDPSRALDITAGSTAPSDTPCRDPPSSGGRLVVRAGDTARPHHDIDVVDDLGHPAPIGPAELTVIETFLGDVLGGVVTASFTANDRQTA